MRFTSAHAIATTALFVALGGTSYAVSKLPKNSVGSEQVRDGSLQAGDLAAGVVSSGPRGPRGAQGPAGAQGAIGPAGADVTQSRNPAIFRAHGVSDQPWPAFGAQKKVLLGGEDFDPNNVYDAGLSVFTAPVDGYYSFSGSVNAGSTGPNDVRLFAEIDTDRPGGVLRGEDITSAWDQQRAVSGVMQLSAGQRVWLELFSGANGSVAITVPGSGAAGQYTSFGGYLISRT